MPLMREKRVELNGMQVSIYMDVNRLERIQKSLPYRFLVRPVLSWLDKGGQGRNGHQEGDGQVITPSPEQTKPDSPEAQVVYDRIAGVEWYHTLDLPHGVSTPGYVDHRKQVDLYGLPKDMYGMRALDVATYDGFWAFEMERRGAEVVAIDVDSLEACDYPRRYQQHVLEQMGDRKTGAGFRIARKLLGSSVERRIVNVYDLSLARLGTFDFAFISDLLLHLRDPALALEKVGSVVKPGGQIIVAEPYSAELDHFTQPLSRFGYAEALGWWQHSRATLKTMMWAAGFDDIEEISRFRLECKAAVPILKVVLTGRQGVAVPDA